MKLLVCTAKREQVIRGLDQLALHPCPEAVVHGACKNSPDVWAAAVLVERCGARELPFPADWEADGKAAGFVRNQRMLDVERPDRVLAFWDGRSRGTAHMIARAVEAGTPVEIIPT